MCCGVNVIFVRQVLLEVAVCLISFTSGIILAFPSVLNPAILASDADIKVTPDQASWIVTYLGLGGLVGYAILPTIFEIFGRKMANIVTNLFILIGSVMLYVAKDVHSLAFARLTQGLSIGGTIISVVALCECVSPKRRGYFMVLNKISLGLGSLACHALAFVLNWRQIAIYGSIGNLISLIIFIICAESPSYFAARGQFDKCAETFKWYRGDSVDAVKELNEFMSAQMENFRLKETEKDVSTLRKLKKILMTKEFQKSFLIVTLAFLCIDSCGRYYLIAFITQILMEITNNTVLSRYIAVAFDCILVVALCISSVLVKYFNRRTLLFRLGFLSVFLMFMVSFSIILRNHVQCLHDLKWITTSLILLQVFITNIGLVPVAFALTGEVFSLEHRAFGSFASGIVFLIFFNIVLKFTPVILETKGVEGTYIIYGVFLLIFLSLLRTILPETKDKTLQQIEYDLKNTVRNHSNKELLKLCKVRDSC